MNEQPNQTQNQTQKSGDSKTLVTVIIIIVVVLAVLGIGGYFISRYMAQKAGEALSNIKTNDSGTTALNLGDTSVKTGALASWPTDLPIALQPPEDITIKSATKMASNQTWIVNISDIPTNAIDNYIDELVSDKGWTKLSDDNVFVRIIQLEKDNWKLAISYDEPSRGAQLTVSPK